MFRIIRTSFLFVIAVAMLSCGNRKKNIQKIDGKSVQIENITENDNLPVDTFTVDRLLREAVNLVDKKVLVKGTVIHVCQQHSGKRCQLMGSNEDIIIRVEAGEKIGAFTQEQMGSDLTITGYLKEIKAGTDNHDGGGMGGEGRHARDGRGKGSGKGESKGLHRADLSGKRDAEKDYFLEGLTFLDEEY